MSQKTDNINTSVNNSQESTTTMEIEQPRIRRTNESKIDEFYNEIQDFFRPRGFVLNDPKESLKLRSQNLNYTCLCGKTFSRTFKDIKRDNKCRTCTTEKLSKVSNDFSICPNDDPNEKWVSIKGGFISSKGRCVSAAGTLLIPDERQRYFVGGSHKQAKDLMAEGFKIKGSENLNGQKSNAVVRNIDKDTFDLENMQVITRNQVGKENGSKSRQSDKFKEKQNMNIADHCEKFRYIRSTIIPEYWVFEDGNIYNTLEGQGGKRFLVGTKSNTENSKQYLKINRNNGYVYVHRLVCMTFYPIEGKNTYEDYKELQVNHKDGNTLNNHKDNLEWSTPSQNMNHAYSEGLNKKVRNIIQYEKNKDGSIGKQIAEYISIAEASRQTKIPEHKIRTSAQGNQSTEFIFKFKDESQSAEFSMKFSNGPNRGAIVANIQKSTRKKVTRHDKE